MQRLLLRTLTPSLVLMTASCGSGQSGDAVDRASAIYAIVIRAVVSKPAPLPEPLDMPVFVVAGERATLSLEVQAAVADELHEFATIRFVDEASQAVDVDEPGRPVREHGVLVTLGEIPDRGDVVTVEAERYERADATLDYRVRVELTDSTWTTTRVSAR